MPTDRLTAYTSPTVEAAIWRVLDGHSSHATAEEFGLRAAELSAAVTAYRDAGRAALAAWRDCAWQQLYLRFPDWHQAESIASTHLLPLLAEAEQGRVVDRWWFMRKHPCWRLRVLPGSPGTDAVAELAGNLGKLTEAGHLESWWPGAYEAETAAFGGPPGIDAAHRLFAADSRGVLELAALGETGMGRRELSILLCGALMHDGARLEWYERGDVWDRVANERRLPADVPAAKLTEMAGSINILLRAHTSPDGPMFGADGTLAKHQAWAGAFRETGRELADAHHAGALGRGLRDVLSYHVIFHWNRLGLPARTQAILAHAVRQAILGARAASE